MSMNRMTRVAVGGVVVAGAALLSGAAPAVAGPDDTASPGADPLTSVVGGALSSLPGSDSKDPNGPTPAPVSPYNPGGAAGGPHPLGVPVVGVVQAVSNAVTSFAPPGGSSPYNSSATGTAGAPGAVTKVIEP